MRTTLNLPDPLYREAQRLARKRKVTFQALMTDALRCYLANEGVPRRAFRLPDCSFKGDGLAEGLSEADWARIRELADERRGS